MAAVEPVDTTGLAGALLDPIPANRLFGLEVVSAADGVGTVAMEVAHEATNVIGTLHSSGLVALADAAGLAAIISLAGAGDELDRLIPLGSVARMTFIAPGRGRLTGRCRLAEADRHVLGRLLAERIDRVTVDTEAVISDEAGDLVCRGAFTWKVRRVSLR